MTDPVNQFPVRVLAVIVLYKLKPSECVTLDSLQAAKINLAPGQANIEILLYDNTPGGQGIGLLPANIRYKADLKNGGLAEAYNYALKIACDEGFDWLLTLDQDTHLPGDFLGKLCDSAVFVASSRSIAAIVPCVSSDKRVMSPWIPTKHWALVRRFPDGFIGIPSQKVYAANSASTMRVKALGEVGGYDPRFRLDFSDLVMYYRLQCNNFRVFVAGNIRVEHELSGFDLRGRSSPERYIEFHAAEEAFYDEYLSNRSGLVLLLRMLYRLIYRLWSQGGSLPYFRVTLRFFCRRLFCSRNHRRKTRSVLFNIA